MPPDRVDDRPFVDQPMTDLDRATRAATVAADRWGLATPTLLRRGMNALYASDGVIVRVGDATAHASLAHRLVAVLADHGVPTVPPIPGLADVVDGLAVTAWRRIEPNDEPIDWHAVGRFVRRVHELPIGEVPAGYPLPSPVSFPWWDFETLLGDLVDEIDEPAAHGLLTAIERHGDWRSWIGDDPVVCHGDVHPGNVLVSGDGPLLIDWDLLCVATPAWDHAMLTTWAPRWGGPAGTYRAFAEGYGVSLADDPLTRSIAELRNVAATLMRVRAGRTDPVAAVEADRRLRYWRGEPDAPIWRAQ